MIKFVIEIEQMETKALKVEVNLFTDGKSAFPELIAGNIIRKDIEGVINKFAKGIGKGGGNVIYAKGESAQKIIELMKKGEGNGDRNQRPDCTG